MNIKYGTVLLTVLIATGSVGCFGRWRGGDPAAMSAIDEQFSASEEAAQTRLKEMIREHILSEPNYSEARAVPVIFRRPFYFREYAVYPDGPDGFITDFREIDSRTRPLMAEVTLNKIRYATQMHRKRQSALADASFLRDTGVETLVFEWHNGRWTRTGAVFNAHTTEEQIDGQWVPRRAETVRVNPEEEQPGWFGRMWQRVRREE